MSITAEKTVRELAVENPAATRVFEKLGIDYCCGGDKSLEEACRVANLPVDEVLDSLEMAEQALMLGGLWFARLGAGRPLESRPA